VRFACDNCVNSWPGLSDPVTLAHLDHKAI